MNFVSKLNSGANQTGANKNAVKQHLVPKTELPIDSTKPCQSGSTDSWFRRMLFKRLNHLEGGRISVFENGTLSTVLKPNESSDARTSAGNSNLSSNELVASVVVADASFYRKIVFGGTIGSAESYIDGDWATDDLTGLIRIIIRNLKKLTLLEKTWARAKNGWYWFQHTFRHNSIKGSRRNIHEHYDLGNEFYELFLDPTMSYSSGIFAGQDLKQTKFNDAAEAMHRASRQKMKTVCEKLQLKSSNHILEIGTGWGGLAIYMAKNFGCRVTTTTISSEQFKYAREAIDAAGLSDQITILKQDYRDLTGQFDKIVSIEMIEAVGHQYFDQFFQKCSQLLTDSGLILLQAITMSEQNYAYHIRHVDFIRRYVFPGGCLPSIVALNQSVGRVTDMRALHTEDITEHYAQSLSCWRSEFCAKLDRVRELGYDESFIRLWHFYLCYCEAAFAERRVHLAHLVYAKPGCEIDPVNDYRPSVRSESSLRNSSRTPHISRQQVGS